MTLFQSKKGNKENEELPPVVYSLYGLHYYVQDFGFQAERSHEACHPPGPDLLSTQQVHGRQRLSNLDVMF